MKRFLLAILFLIFVPAVWFVSRTLYEMHPWTPAGAAFLRGKWKFNDYEFEVWQIKNRTQGEPFSDGLFIRRGTNAWQAYMLDFDDNYGLRVGMKQSNSIVEMSRNGGPLGGFDMATGTFLWRGGDLMLTPGGIGNATNPPGQWHVGKN